MLLSPAVRKVASLVLVTCQAWGTKIGVENRVTQSSHRALEVRHTSKLRTTQPAPGLSFVPQDGVSLPSFHTAMRGQVAGWGERATWGLKKKNPKQAHRNLLLKCYKPLMSLNINLYIPGAGQD